MRVVLAAFLTCSFLIAAGCTSQKVGKVATAIPTEDESIVQPAPRTGTYSIRFTADKKKIKSPLYASADRFMLKGEPLGFSVNEAGELIAISRTERIPLDIVPAGATHVMWYHKSKQPTMLAKNAAKVGEGAREVTIVAVKCAFIAGGFVVLVGVTPALGACP